MPKIRPAMLPSVQTSERPDVETLPAVLVAELEPVGGSLVPAYSAGNVSGADTDGELVGAWLASKRSAHTRRAYEADALAFLAALASMGRTLRTTTARDVQAWAATLEGAPATRARRIASAKSILAFGHRLGYLPVNVGGVLVNPALPNDLAQRILEADDVRALVAAAAPGRDATLVRTLYGTGARISEACGLRWEHVQPQPNGEAVVTLHGKGGKTRHVRIAVPYARALAEHRPADASPNAPVFVADAGGALSPDVAGRIVRRAAARAGLRRGISPHWLRHAHASHALASGADVALVRDSLGHASLATTSRYTHARPNDGAGLYLASV